MQPSDQPEGEASICIGCGFCCDGTLHGHTVLPPRDQAHSVALGLSVERLHGRLIFRQPCPKFADGMCTIYAERPEPCRGYRCKLRKDLDEGRISFFDAGEKIETAKGLISRIKEVGAWCDTPADRERLWRELEENLSRTEGEAHDHSAKAALSLAALDVFLDRWFRRKNLTNTD